MKVKVKESMKEITLRYDSGQLCVSYCMWSLLKFEKENPLSLTVVLVLVNCTNLSNTTI